MGMSNEEALGQTQNKLDNGWNIQGCIYKYNTFTQVKYKTPIPKNAWMLRKF